MTVTSRAIRICFTVALAAAGCGSDPVSGESLYLEPADDGNTFACATCHALDEPAADGILRPGHPIGDAAARPHYKNGQLTELREAANICRVEWMAASPWSEEDADWLALEAFLVEQAPAQAEPLTIEIAAPPADLSGGDAMEGQELFNGRCIACHGENGVGTQRAPEITGLGLDLDYIAERVRLSGAGNSDVYDGLTGGRMPFWSAGRLSDAELIDIATYVSESADSGDGNPTGGDGDGDGDGELRDCDATHPTVGRSAILEEIFHDVGGTATIVDDCTIEIDGFTFDGQGIDVQVYGGAGGDYGDGFSMSGDIRRSTPYAGEKLKVQLPETHTLDDLDGISIWCVPAEQSFGDGLFQ